MVSVRIRIGLLLFALSASQTVAGSWLVSGTVLRPGGFAPAVGVEVTFIDLVTGDPIATPGNVTDANGEYRVAVPVGIYDLFLAPPPDPSQLAPLRLEEISVDGSGDVTIPSVNLFRGVQLTGRVLDESQAAVPSAQLEFRSTTSGDPVTAQDAETDAAGNFDTILRQGTYDLEIHPPAGSSLASLRVPDIAAFADQALGTRTLVEGFSVSGTVRDELADPQREVVVDVAEFATGMPFATTRDQTDGSGDFTIRLPAGTYNFTFTPTINGLIQPRTRLGITIDQPAVLEDVELFFRNTDGDLVADVFDVCPFRPTLFQEDADGDLAGGTCDNCPLFANPRQEDNDGTGGGDVCDPDDDDDFLTDLSDSDMDGDLIFNVLDNCPAAWNPSQEDDDANGVGDACDPDDGQVEYVEARTKIGLKWRRENSVLGYRVYRQRLSRLSNVNVGLCVQHAAGDHNFLVLGDPEPGEGFAYVITAEMPGGEGMLGRRSDGVERPNLRPCN